MKSSEDAWNCITWVVWIFGFIVLVVGVFIGIAIKRWTNSAYVEDDTNTKTMNETIGYLDSECDYSIPKNTQIVAACGGGSGMYAFIVKNATNEQYYIVHLYTKQVESIPFVDVVTKTKTKAKKEIKNL